MVSRLEELDRERGEKKRHVRSTSTAPLKDGAAAGSSARSRRSCPSTRSRRGMAGCTSGLRSRSGSPRAKAAASRPSRTRPWGASCCRRAVRNMIERLVKSGALKARRWTRGSRKSRRRRQAGEDVRGGERRRRRRGLLLHEALQRCSTMPLGPNSTVPNMCAGRRRRPTRARRSARVSSHIITKLDMEWRKWKKPNRMLAMLRGDTRSAMDGCAKESATCWVSALRVARADKMTLVDRDYDAAALCVAQGGGSARVHPEPEVDVADVQLYDDDSTWMNEWLAGTRSARGRAGS